MAARSDQIGAIVFVDAHALVQKTRIPESKNVIYQAQTGGCPNLSSMSKSGNIKTDLLGIIGRHNSFDTSVTDAIGQLLVSSKATSTLSSSIATDESRSLRSTYSLYPSSDIYDRVFDRNSDWDDAAQNAYEYEKHQIEILWKSDQVYCSIQSSGNWFKLLETDQITLKQICDRFEMPPGFKLLIVSVACDAHPHDPHRVDLGTERFDIAEIKKYLAKEWYAHWIMSNPRFDKSRPLSPALQAEQDRSVESVFQELQQEAKDTGKTMESVLISYQKKYKHAGGRKTPRVSKKKKQRRTRKH